MPQHATAGRVTVGAGSARTHRRSPTPGAPLALAAVLGSCVLAAPAQAEPATTDAEGTRPVTGPQDPQAATPSAPAVRTLTAAAPVRAAGPTYTVRPGDTVSHIAARSGVSSAAIIAANGLDRRGFIRAGQVLTLPGAAGSAPAAPASSGTRHTVRAGETVSHIAARTGVSSAAIIAANGLDRRGFIRAGQVLTLPGGSPAAAPAPASTSASGGYTVRAGDTLSHIAVRSGTTVAALRAANPGLDARGTIRVGQRLTVPGGSGASAPASAPAATPTSRYTVRSGDTLSHIAARTGTTVAAIRGANPQLDARGTIRVGQTISLPSGTAAPMANSFAGRTYPDSTVAAATANRDALASRSVPSREQMRQIIADTARRYGVDPALAQAIGFQESGFNQRAVSPANAVGAMQVIPSSGTWASQMAGRRLDLLDPHDNALAGVLILRANLRAADDEAQGIAAYYQGLAGVRKNGMYPDTRRYVANVQTLAARYR
ncbi:LysM peptidoglycan-binding domain-containing protein [Thalassiella azotivora]